jgi:hypothetical protein
MIETARAKLAYVIQLSSDEHYCDAVYVAYDALRLAEMVGDKQLVADCLAETNKLEKIIDEINLAERLNKLAYWSRDY